MKNARRRVLNTLLAAVLALGLMPSFAFAGEGNSAPRGGVECFGGVECNHVAAIGNIHYETLAAAVDAAQDGNEIDLLRTTEGSGVVVEGDEGRQLTIDLNGFTYTVVDPTVGSPSTETNAFQLLKGSTVTFKNGTIMPGTDEAKILFQNYCNLTLDRVTVDCTGSKCQYVASNNCGNTVIRDSALIAAAGQAAFDVYYWPNGGYEEGVSVTVEGDSVVSGRVEYGGDNTTGSIDVAKFATLDIKGGIFTGQLRLGTLGTSSKAGINITGGTFKATDGSDWNVSDYVQPGMTQDASGSIVISDNAVAKIDSVGYKTLQAAVAAAEDGDTIELLKNHTSLSNVQTIEGKDLTLDLGGNTLTQQLDVKDCHLTLKNGTVESPSDGAYLSGGAAVYVYGSSDSNAAADSCVLDVESTATLRGYYGILISGSAYGDNDAYGAIVNVKGTVEGPIFIAGNMGNTAALNPNGNAVTVNIHSGAKLDGNDWKGGAEGTHAIAMNGAAIINVEDGAILIGTDAIAVKRGQLNITGGTFTATGEKVDPAEANNNGSETTGSAISVTSTYNKKISGLSGIDINISGGIFTSENNAAVYLGHSANSNTLVGYRGDLTVNITGGSFKSAENVPSVYVAEKIAADTGLTVTGENVAEKFISGGFFSSNVTDYVQPGMEWDSSTGGIVPAEGSAAAIGNKGYETLEAALNDAVSGNTVALLESAVLPGGIGNGVTLQVLNGKTLTVNEPDCLITGTLEIQAGGVLMLPKTSSGTEAFIGGDDARLSLTKGNVTLAATADGAVVTLKNGSEANIPADKELVLTFQAGWSCPMNAVVENGAKLTVNKKLTVANNSVLTVGGTLNVASGGILRVNSAATLNGNGTVSNSGIVTLHHGENGDTIVNIPITLASGGVVYSQFDASSIEINNSAKSELNPAASVNGVANSNETDTGTEPLFGFKYSYYVASAPVPTPEEYDVSVGDFPNGKVSADPAKAEEGDEVTLTVTPDEGYELAAISVVGPDGEEVELKANADGTYSFEMPAFDVAVKASFACDGGELCPSHRFPDVDQSQWYHAAIDWAVANGVMTGFDAGELAGLFGPDMELTRAQMAQILWNVEGRPAVDYAVAFGDVSEGDWFYGAVAWAASEGVFEGYDDGSGLFGPDDALTREQAAAVLMRWTEANGGDVAGRADLSGYPDAASVDEWAVEYVSWAVAASVISGVEQEDGSLLLDPAGTATRAQTAMLMMRLVG